LILRLVTAFLALVPISVTLLEKGGSHMRDRDLERRFLSVRELAQETGESVAVWRKRVFKRLIPFVRLGRNVRVKRQDFENFCESGRVAARQQETGDAEYGLRGTQ
jgi:excisionase family DNA binding protein